MQNNIETEFAQLVARVNELNQEAVIEAATIKDLTEALINDKPPRDELKAANLRVFLREVEKQELLETIAGIIALQIVEGDY